MLHGHIWKVTGLLGSGASALSTVVKWTRRINFRNKVVVITGGSRGLGLSIARQLADQNARLALIARDEKELEVAHEELQGKTQVEGFVCDVTSKEQVDKTIGSIIEKLGTIDILINNAGVIQVGPLENQSIEDFENAMNTHFFANLYTTFAVLPTMRAKRSGRIVNIASIGGKISVPHLLPYCTSKFALVGFSQGLRSELLQHGIYVTTVCPGLMRTGSHLQAEFKGRNKVEYALFSTLNALPIVSTAADDAAKQIIKACRDGDAELIISAPAQLATRVQALFAGETSEVLAVLTRALPQPNGKKQQSKKGKESRSELSPNVITEPIEKAAIENNQWSEIN